MEKIAALIVNPERMKELSPFKVLAQRVLDIHNRRIHEPDFEPNLPASMIDAICALTFQNKSTYPEEWDGYVEALATINRYGIEGLARIEDMGDMRRAPTWGHFVLYMHHEHPNFMTYKLSLV